MKELGDSFNTFVEKLRSSESPEALAYLRLMQHELGYIRTSDFKQFSEDIAKYANIVFKSLPAKVRTGKNEHLLEKRLTRQSDVE